MPDEPIHSYQYRDKSLDACAKCGLRREQIHRGPLVYWRLVPPRIQATEIEPPCETGGTNAG